MRSKRKADQTNMLDSSLEGSNACRGSIPLPITTEDHIAKRKPEMRSETKLSAKSLKPSSSETGRKKLVVCPQHADLNIRFICTQPSCLKELCDLCILDHKEHISTIQSIYTIINKSCEELEAKDLKSVKSAIIHRETDSFNKIDNFLDEFYSSLKTKIQALKRKMLFECSSKTNFIEQFGRFKEMANRVAMKRENITPELLTMLKDFLLFEQSPKYSSIQVDPTFFDRFDNVFNECVLQKDNFESGDEGNPKLIHWFEWENKKLYIYDIIKNFCKNISLDIAFTVPLYSRSIMIPSGVIYLMGGEDTAGQVRSEVYKFNAANYEENTKLEMKCSMSKGKYDFSVCYLDDYIYTIGGKDTKSEVLGFCERYNIKRNCWEAIAPLNVKRYAASCTAVKNKKSIFLFGGIHEEENKTVDCIEEYQVEKDVWVNLQVRTLIWQSVEISAVIQIRSDEILIFGGNSPKLRDTDNSYIFNIKDFTFKKTKSNLRKPQVFISAPFLFANKVYALGNEYYVKKRNINRYDIATGEWDIILYN